MKEEVFRVLKEMDIQYEVVNHPAAWTTEEADAFIEGKEGVRSKTMFMGGKKDRVFYLIILDDEKRLEIKKLNDIVGDKLHFGKEEDLKKKMNLTPGVVSLFGLMYDKNREMKVYIDRNLEQEKIITFHPNDNTATIFIKIEDMFRMLSELGYEYNLVSL